MLPTVLVGSFFSRPQNTDSITTGELMFNLLFHVLAFQNFFIHMDDPAASIGKDIIWNHVELFFYHLIFLV